MKLIEKLALEISREEGCGECAYHAALKAFRKAREMALELEDQYAGQFQLRKHLETLGEEEVKS